MKTQQQIVKDKLLKDGQITNVWSVQHYILRLSSLINRLRNEGMSIHGEYLKRGKNKTRTYQYYI